MSMRVAALTLLLVLSGCSAPPLEQRFHDWRLEDDLAAYRAQPSYPERDYRIGQLSDALHGPEYQRFLELVRRAPAGRRALIYYQVSGANGIWFFALAVDGSPCRIVATDYDGTREHSCSGFSAFAPVVDASPVPIRDCLVAGLVQYEPGRAPMRAMTLVSAHEAEPSTGDSNLLAKIRRVFSRHAAPSG